MTCRNNDRPECILDVGMQSAQTVNAKITTPGRLLRFLDVDVRSTPVLPLLCMLVR